MPTGDTPVVPAQRVKALKLRIEHRDNIACPVMTRAQL
jgi:hypothetical protein